MPNVFKYLLAVAVLIVLFTYSILELQPKNPDILGNSIATYSLEKEGRTFYFINQMSLLVNNKDVMHAIELSDFNVSFYTHFAESGFSTCIAKGETLTCSSNNQSGDAVTIHDQQAVAYIIETLL